MNGLDASDSPPTVRAAFLAAAPGLSLGLICGAACSFAAGPTAGLFFGGVAMATLIAPPLLAGETVRWRQAFVAASVVDGVALPWLLAVSDPAVSILDWVRAYLLLAADVLALWGLLSLLVSLRIAPLFASAIVVVLGMAWLAWPVWLSPWLAGRQTLVGWLVCAHPLFGLDGALRHLGPPWTERHLMYTRLTVLNQDVAYSLPPGVGRAVVVHAALGAIGLFVSNWVSARRVNRNQAGGGP